MKPSLPAIKALSQIIEIDAPPCEVREAVRRALVSVGKTLEMAAEASSDFEEEYAVSIGSYVRSKKAKGTAPPFVLNMNDPLLIQGSCYVETDDPDDLAVDKRKRANSRPMLEAIVALTEREFELLCGVLLSKLSVSIPYVTKSSGDQGVDFFGKANFGAFVSGTSLLGPVSYGADIWLVGQAKRYLKTRVKTSDLRELVGSVELARANISSDGGVALSEFNIRLCEPVFYLMVTSGQFTSGSERLLEAAGLIGLDGEKLANFLSDHNVGSDEDGSFDRSLFKQQIMAVSPDVREAKTN